MTSKSKSPKKDKISSTSPEKSLHKHGRDLKGRFKKGHSGNIKGKQPGTRHKATQIAENLIQGKTKDLMEKALTLALGGDTTMLKVMIERLVPKCRHASLNLSLPEIKSVKDVPVIVNRLIMAVAAGEVPAAETGHILNLIDGYRRSVETLDLEKRIETLETQLEKRKR